MSTLTSAIFFFITTYAERQVYEIIFFYVSFVQRYFLKLVQESLGSGVSLACATVLYWSQTNLILKKSNSVQNFNAER